MQQDSLQLLVDTNGNTVSKPTAMSSDNDLVNHKEFAKENQLVDAESPELIK